MKRSDIVIGMRVVPSGKGYTKDWHGTYVGTVVGFGRPYYVHVKWDEFDQVYTHMRALHLEPEKQGGTK